ncbi:MAG: hypothetical protein GY854_04425 [Deltaproteobacteria bacterium]|nr:hypothetical protein [Deltaproteobacteria bacterium]
MYLPRKNPATPGSTKVNLFGVLCEKSLIATQENLPTIILGEAEDADLEARWTWTVTEVTGLTGKPNFWLTSSSSEDTIEAKLNWTGINPKDWELGRKGQIIAEATSSDGGYFDIPIDVAVRSIDCKDFTFFTPDTYPKLTICKTSEFGGDFEARVESSDITGLITIPYPDGGAREFGLSLGENAVLDQVQDGMADLVIEDGVAEASRIRIQVAKRILTYTTTVDEVETQVPLIKNKHFMITKTTKPALMIEGEPTQAAGYSWEIIGFEGPPFKQNPVFAPMSLGTEAELDLEEISDWDWIFGTKGAATLVVRDGMRAPVEIPFTFELEKDQSPIALTAGTVLTGPNGEVIEIAEDGRYAPIIDGNNPETATIKLLGVPIRAVDSGADSNMKADTELVFSEPPIPMIQKAVVDSEGLNMGDDDETDDELRSRVRVLWADPPGHGNRSHLFQIATEVEGVDRAFVYPPIALDGRDGMGKAGVALVAPGRRPGVGAESALSEAVREQLVENASFTGGYVMMTVDGKGALDEAAGKHECQVDIDIQLKLDDEERWKMPATQNLVVSGYDAEDKKLTIFRDDDDPVREEEVNNIAKSLATGDVLYLMGMPISIVDLEYLEDHKIVIAEELVDEEGQPIPLELVIGKPLYPKCPMQTIIEKTIDEIFKDLGTSEAPRRDMDLPWQRRYPRTNFAYPAELRVAEIFNRIMDLNGIEDMRILSPDGNMAPPNNNVEVSPDGERTYTTYILSLRRIAVGPYRPTPGVDEAKGYVGP